MKNLYCIVTLLVLAIGSNQMLATDTAVVQQEQLPWSITAGIVAGAAMHTTNFIELPGFPNCCEPYTSGSGLALGANVGIELRTGIELFDNAVKVNLSLGYQRVPGTLTVSEEVGNIINGSTVTNGVVQHELDLSYSGLTIHPTVALPLPSINGLHLVIGGMGMLPLSASITQQQTLTSPSSLEYTFENGQRIREQQSGSLTNATALALWAVVGLRYDVQIDRAWTLAPTVCYLHGLNDIATETDWKVSAIQAGVTVAYRLPKPEPPKPEPPKQPVVEAPIVAKPVPALHSSVSLAARTPGSKVVGDTVFTPVITESIVDSVIAVAPTLYFEHNSTVPIGGEEALLQFTQAISQSMVDTTDQVEHITITGSTSFDEDKRLARERISRLLNSVVVDQNRVTIVQEHAAQKKYPELDSEKRFVSIALGTTPRMLHRYSEFKRVNAVSAELSILHTVTCEAGPCTTNVAVSGAIPSSITTTDPVIPITVPVAINEKPQPSLVGVSLTTTDAAGKQVTSSSAIVVVPTLADVHRMRVHVDPAGTVRRQAFLLALFDFDGVTPSAVDYTVVTSAQEAIKAGKRVTLVPCSDAFGTTEHNLELRKQRGQAGMQLLGNTKQTQIDFESNLGTTPEAPRDRYLQRSVWVVIE